MSVSGAGAVRRYHPTGGFGPPPGMAGVPPITRAEGRVSIVATILVISFFLPQEMSIFFLGQRWTPSRLVLAVLTPYLALRFVIVLLEAPRGIAIADIVLILPGAWMLIASAQTGDTRWLSFGGSSAMELLIPYAAARSLLRTEAHLLSTVRLFALCVGVTGYLAILDSLSGTYLIKQAVTAITGVPTFHWIEYRLGIMRAYSVYEHPILLGVASVMGVMITLYVQMRGRWFILAGCFIGLFLSLSSGPVAGMAAGVALYAYDRVTRGLRWRWQLLTVMIVLPLTLLFLLHPAPWGVLFRLILFDPQTAWWRIWTFELVWPHIMVSPWTGYGDARQAAVAMGATTIDGQWLGLIIAFGFPTAIGVMLVMFGSCSVSTGPFSPARLTPQGVLMARVLGIMMFLFFFIGCTVSYWGTMYLASSFLAGMRASIGAVSRQPQR